MTNYSRIINGLRTAPLLGPQDMNLAGQSNGNESLALEAFNDRMLSELRNRRFQAARLGRTDEVGALEGLASGYEADRAASPLMDQRAEMEAQRKADLAAQSVGFRGEGRGLAYASPSQQAGEYAREWQEYNANRPYREAALRQQTAVEQARTQGEYALKRQQLIEDTKRDQYREFQDFLGSRLGEAGGNNQDIRSLRNTPQGPSVTFGPSGPQGAEDISASLLNKLTDATNAWARAGNSSQKAAALQALQQARAAIISSYAGNEGNKYFVQEMLGSPETMDLPVQQWIQMFKDKYGSDLDAGDFTDADIDEINQLTGLVRRQPQLR